MAKTAAEAPNPVEKGDTAPAPASTTHVLDSVDFAKFADAVKEDLKDAADATAKYLGFPEIFGQSDTKPGGVNGAAAEEEHPAAGRGDGQKRGDCFGDPELPEGVHPSNTEGGRIPPDVNKPPVDGDDTGRNSPAPARGPLTAPVTKPPETGYNPLVTDGCFGGYSDTGSENGTDAHPIKSDAHDAAGMVTEHGELKVNALQDLTKILPSDAMETVNQTLRGIAATITQAWTHERTENTGDKTIPNKGPEMKDVRSVIDGHVKEQFEVGLKKLNAELNGAYPESQQLVKDVFDAISSGTFNDNLRSEVKRAAAEFAANPDSPEAKKAMEAIKNAFARGGIDAKIGANGLEINDPMNSISIDQFGNLNASKRLHGPNSPLEPTSAEKATLGLHSTYITNAMNMHQMKHTANEANAIISAVQDKALGSNDNRDKPAPPKPDVIRTPEWKNPIRYAGSELR